MEKATVQSIDRALSIIETLAGEKEGLGVTEISTRVGLHGWSRDDQEHEPGIRCIAAPIYDYRGNIIAAVSTSGLKQIITPARDEEIAGFVMDAAHSISQRMGYRD